MRQGANLWFVKSEVQKVLSSELAGNGDIFLFDGMPISTCNVKRIRRKTILGRRWLWLLRSKGL